MAPQIIKSKFPDFPRINRGNLFDYLHSNPNQVADSAAAFVRPDGKIITRKQLHDDARKLAYAFRHKLGLAPGTRIGIFSPNSAYYPISVHAGLCAGVVLVPMNASYGAEEMAHPVQDASVEYILCHQALLPVARQALQLAQLGAKSQCGQNRLWILDDGDDLKTGDQGERDVRTLLGTQMLETHQVVNDVEEDAYIAYSSGTSGKPKGVQLTHSNITSVTTSIVISFGQDLSKDDRFIGVLPFFHIFGLAKFVHLSFYLGARTIVVPKFDLDVFCAAVEKFRCNVGFIVPPILVLLAKDSCTQKYDLSSLKYLLSGAAPLGMELSQEIEQKFPFLRVTQGWGLSETSPTATFISYREYRDHMGSCGQLLLGVEGRIVDENGNDIGFEQGENGKPGEFWVRGPNIMKGYLNNPQATKECLTLDGWFQTGDVAIMKNGFFWIVDRKKELIKYKGFQVPPAELEALLLSHPQIVDVAVIGIDDPSRATELPRAYVVLSQNDQTKDPVQLDQIANEIIQWTASKVANHKRLRGGVHFLNEIPKSPSGKILRRVLRDQVAKQQK